MNRLQKKCVIVSSGVHLLLLSVLFIGPGFLSEPEKHEDLPILDFIPVKTVDELVSGGGNPKAQPPPAAAPAPAPEPKPKAIEPEPKPPRNEPKPEPKPEPKLEPKALPEPKPQPKDKTEPDPDSLEVEQKPRKPKVNLTPVVRNNSSKAEAKAKAAREAERREREAQDEARRRLAATIGRMANNLGSGLSSSTTIELKGPGGGGVPYANFLQAVKSVYARAWILPDGVTDDDATAVVTVTIARDGSVITHRIVKPSGNQAVDRSVRAALERVTFAAPLPDDAKEDQRTVSINFNVRAKRALG